MRRLLMLVLIAVSAFSAAAGDAPAPAPPALPSSPLPPGLDRVLRDYERAWQAGDADSLAVLFAEDGFVLSNGKPPVRGRAAIRAAYAKAGGDLVLRAFAHSTDGNVGYIIGGYAGSKDTPDTGKFVLALLKGPDGRWLIAADIDNSNAAPRRAPTPP